MLAYRGVSKILKGGSDISWFPKKGHKILKGGGVQWSGRQILHI